MASRLAQVAAQQVASKERLFGGKARDFYLEICRCLPFVQRLHKAEEVVSLRTLRAIVKEQFKAYKDVKDGRVVDLLIFKGREELETYLMMHKQRHHLITEYIEPFYAARKAVHKPTGNTAFLDSFFSTQYPQISSKQY
mmetsp:Transcript_11739/g.25187  ORF Transcript_11739/g.25187 Transcript_11739/m.25187 type:complete len:139 (+) Transcript_11739:95-511(+)|eukprot:CAMPEP_0202920596 /NCGR_PEP_ID=MMETSP1392-20130828/76923_1 /ASSEMBLY_ACC=CAM_ASM_000868 /TAXON_ID=225041 /ORGANISM="Chlamydomonas chlamydogama, Strain SAG 11-48b" /LENGTH=138 /DNA_ID=CAMNT_0049614099 /DNA_START=79 /DNA_END=495 /DNA_ORIENTATION=-